MKLIFVLLALATIAAGAPRSRNYFADYLLKRISGGCAFTKEELEGLEASGVDLRASSIECPNDPSNDLVQLDETEQKRACSFDYSATPSCCSPDCDWIMELHCMSPIQMICKKK